MANTNKATMDLMDQLHLLTAEKFAQILKEGVAVQGADGEVKYVDPSPAYISAAVKFLKDNDITVDLGSGRMDPLEEALEGIPDIDEHADPEQFAYRQ